MSCALTQKTNFLVVIQPNGCQLRWTVIQIETCLFAVNEFHPFPNCGNWYECKRSAHVPTVIVIITGMFNVWGYSMQTPELKGQTRWVLSFFFFSKGLSFALFKFFFFFTRGQNNLFSSLIRFKFHLDTVLDFDIR